MRGLVRGTVVMGEGGERAATGMGDARARGGEGSAGERGNKSGRHDGESGRGRDRDGEVDGWRGWGGRCSGIVVDRCEGNGYRVGEQVFFFAEECKMETGGSCMEDGAER